MTENNEKMTLQEFFQELEGLGAKPGRQWIVTNGSNGIVWRSFVLNNDFIFVQMFDNEHLEVLVPLKYAKDEDHIKNQLKALKEYYLDDLLGTEHEQIN